MLRAEKGIRWMDGGVLPACVASTAMLERLAIRVGVAEPPHLRTGAIVILRERRVERDDTKTFARDRRIFSPPS
jgi:hypothetical protein